MYEGELIVEIKGIKYISPCMDNSGYAKAARGNILALCKAGVPLTVQPISFESARPDLGREGEIIRSLINKKIDYNVVLTHTTPEFWAKYKEPGKLFCGYTIWETTKLHPDWIPYINDTADVVLVGCEWNVDVFKESGITKPIFNVPHVLDTSLFNDATPFEIRGLDKNTFMFYSVMQFTERKNPLATIKAYWQAFPDKENVALVLKTYRCDYSEPEKETIRTTMKRLKAVCPAKNYPPIYLILDMLSEQEMTGLHARGDCYVSLDRGEGFGLGAAQSGASGKPIIVTGFGGVTEYAKPDNSYLVNYVEVPVHGMPWSPWYLLEQNWAEADQSHGAKLMRHVYENQEEAKAKGQKLKTYLKENFSAEVIGQKIIDAIRSI